MDDRFKIFSESFSRSPIDSKNIVPITILVVLVLLFIAYLVIYNHIKKNKNIKVFGKYRLKRSDFNTLCKSVSLNSEENNALFNLIVKYKIGFPLTCFTNAKLLDSILKRGLTDIENSNNMSEEEKINNNFLLLEIKSKIELNSKKNMGIRSTHFMVEGQKVILFCRGKGYFYASVKRILNNITIVEIISKKVTRRIFAKNEFLKAYFWREEDAGYTFETQIVDFEEDIRIYHIKHSDKLVRSQKRKYRRVPLNISGELYQVDLKIENNKRVYSLLTDKVVVCNLIELSAGGLKAKSDTMEEKEGIVKVEFEINKYPVSAIGRIVRFHHYAYGLKEFTIQFVKLKMRDKNLINKYVFNYFPDFI